MKLADIQHDFIAALFGNQKEAAAKHVKSDSTLTAQQRVGIYRGSVHGILTQALEQTFPVCKMLVGEKFFDRMCSVYIDQYPPSSPFFADFGTTVPEFLNEFGPAKSVPYLADMSKLEWLRKRAFDSVEAQQSDFSKLMEIPDSEQANLVFTLKPSLQLMQSAYRVDQIWFAHQTDSDNLPQQIESDGTVKLAIWKTANELALWNFENDSTASSPSSSPSQQNNQSLWTFVQMISEQARLQQLAEQFSDKLPGYLGKCIQHDWLQSYAVQDPNN